MSLRWEIGNKVKILKGWARQRFGRLTGNRQWQITGKSDRAAGKPKQPGGEAGDGR
ncbi:CsbD family protein [Nonomuraea bangladeshensis]|uniref:CsbD family protein n=1 Tax=Nonomuraea bangladeshensis TaxID=404385 RepID=A0ABV3GZE1_9ACTN